MADNTRESLPSEGVGITALGWQRCMKKSCNPLPGRTAHQTGHYPSDTWCDETSGDRESNQYGNECDGGKNRGAWFRCG